jgi:hypothetical protein
VLGPPVPEPKAVLEARKRQADVLGSVFCGWVQGRFADGAPRAYRGLEAIGLLPGMHDQSVADYFKVYQKQPPHVVAKAWNRTSQILAAFRNATQADGARLAIVYVPHRIEIDETAWESLLKTPA